MTLGQLIGRLVHDGLDRYDPSRPPRRRARNARRPTPGANPPADNRIVGRDAGEHVNRHSTSAAKLAARRRHLTAPTAMPVARGQADRTPGDATPTPTAGSAASPTEPPSSLKGPVTSAAKSAAGRGRLAEPPATPITDSPDSGVVNGGAAVRPGCSTTSAAKSAARRRHLTAPPASPIAGVSTRHPRRRQTSPAKSAHERRPAAAADGGAAPTPPAHPSTASSPSKSPATPRGPCTSAAKSAARSARLTEAPAMPIANSPDSGVVSGGAVVRPGRSTTSAAKSAARRRHLTEPRATPIADSPDSGIVNGRPPVRPGLSATSAAKSGARRRGRRAIPAAVRREVWRRDGGRCTFVDRDSGRRCGSRFLLEIDHVIPYALGGGEAVANLRIRCAAHHRLRHARRPEELGCDAVIQTDT